ncbi:MAG TPA: hypothetical protein VE825_16530 [Terriglobales bacterium]|nr:hypothetical protein [Terriglobales bacterium]
MTRRTALTALWLPCLLLAVTALPAQEQSRQQLPQPDAPQPAGVLWSDPGDITSRDLYYGSGGEDRQPRGVMTFVKEDMAGTSPKFDVVDEEGSKWKVKLGVEAAPETVASRLLWAVGYTTDEEYFVADLKVQGLPAHLHRGQKYVRRDGHVRNARLKRAPEDMKKSGQWKWKENPFQGTREFDGLRVMMAVLNNWDLKDSNTAVYADKSDPGQQTFIVSDLGASFGTTGRSWKQQKGKGNLASYGKSQFITHVDDEYVDFATPGAPSAILFFELHDFVSREQMRWIGHRVSRAHARWMGDLLAQLSPQQIRDAFRAGGYSVQQSDAFARIVEERIAQLEQL